MAYVNTTRATGFNLIERIRAYAADLAVAYRQRAEYRETFEELSNLTDRELDDLGVARANIKQIATEAVYGK